MKVIYKTVRIKFHDWLSEFLRRKTKKYIVHKFIDQTSIKDLIESFNIPHTEVDVIIVNGKSVNFNYLVQNDDRIEVFPESKRYFNFNVYHLKPKLKGRPKFICDVHLGKLFKIMRMSGLDVLYSNNYTDEEIVEISTKDDRIILTRDTGLLKRKNVKYGHFVRGNNPEKQFLDILVSYSLLKYLKPFSLCLNCGTKLKRISKKNVLNQLKDFKFREGIKFYYCKQCNQTLWEGSHFDNMKKRIDALLLPLRSTAFRSFVTKQFNQKRKA